MRIKDVRQGLHTLLHTEGLDGLLHLYKRLEKRGRVLLLCLLCAEAGWLILVNAWLRLERAYLKLRLGVLARGLARAWPSSRRHVVQVGHALSPSDVACASIHVYPAPFGREGREKLPFPSDPHYDAKAWEQCAARKNQGRVLFWNVAGPG